MIRVAYLDSFGKPFVLKFKSTHIEVVNTNRISLSTGQTPIYTKIGIWMPDGNSALVTSGDDARISTSPTIHEERFELVLRLINHEDYVVFIEEGIAVAKLAIIATGYVNKLEHTYLDREQW